MNDDNTSDGERMLEYAYACKSVLLAIEAMIADSLSREEDRAFQQEITDAIYEKTRHAPVSFKMDGKTSDGHTFRVEFKLYDLVRDVDEEEL